MLVYLFIWWCYVNSYMQYVFPVVMFITSDRGIRTTILLYWVMLTYDYITDHDVKLVFVGDIVVMPIP